MGMASAKENVPVAPRQPLPRQTSSSSRRPPPPLRPKMDSGVSEPPPVSGVIKCTCFRLPIRTKKPLTPPPPAPKLRSARCRSAVAPDLSAAPVTGSQSQRVTFRASASLSSWWPSSPPAASDGAGAGATATPAAPAGSGGSVVVALRRASASSAVAVAPTMKAGAPSTSSPSSSFSHWRRCRRSLSSSRVMPHGERASFSFPVSPASASSSCMSTPKIPQA